MTKFVQSEALKESVTQFHRACRRLRMPAHPDFLSWKRTRQQVRAAAALATHSDPDDASSSTGHTPWGLWVASILSTCIAILGCCVRPGSELSSLSSLLRRLSSQWHVRQFVKVGRAGRHSAVDLRVPTHGNGGGLKRSCSLTQIADTRCVLGGEVRTDLLMDGSLGAVLGGDAEQQRLETSRRSLSLGAKMWRLA